MNYNDYHSKPGDCYDYELALEACESLIAEVLEYPHLFNEETRQAAANEDYDYFLPLLEERKGRNVPID